MTNAVKHIFMIGSSYIFPLWNVFSNLLLILKLGCLTFSSGYWSFVRYVFCKYFIPVCGFPVHFLFFFKNEVSLYCPSRSETPGFKLSSCLCLPKSWFYRPGLFIFLMVFSNKQKCVTLIFVKSNLTNSFLCGYLSVFFVRNLCLPCQVAKIFMFSSRRLRVI